MVQGIYQAAELYHYGFNFRDVKAESTLLTQASDRFGNTGRTFIELACGNSPYAETLIQAGCIFHGLDLSSDMLAFTRARLAKAKLLPNAVLHHADMRQFTIPHKFDLAFVLMGSLHYLNSGDFLIHLEQVYRHLNPGGLYIMEWCIEYEPTTHAQSNWTVESPFGVIGVNYDRRQRSALSQQFDEQIEFTLDGKLVASTTSAVYLRYPNEFVLLLGSRHEQWEIVGHYNMWDLNKTLDGSTTINRPLCILRRK